MALHFKLQLVVATDDDKQVSVDELVVLSKDYERLEHLGCSATRGPAPPRPSPPEALGNVVVKLVSRCLQLETVVEDEGDVGGRGGRAAVSGNRPVTSRGRGSSNGRISRTRGGSNH